MRLSTLLLLGVFGLGFAQAGILDFKDIEKAKEAYKKKNYDATIAHLNSLKDSIKDPALEYDIANAYYKKGKYQEALKHYEKAKGVDEADRLYNTGNAYANSGDIESAIDAYEQSLKIRDDEDARKNLEILKQKKKEQDQQNQDQKDQKNQDEKDQNKQDKDKQNQNREDQKKDDNASQKKSPKQDKKESSEDQKKSENKNQEKKDTKSMTPKEKQEALSKKQIKHLMDKLKSKEMPTMMYESGNPKEREDDEKPW